MQVSVFLREQLGCMVNNEEQKSCCLQRAIPKEQKCAVSVYQGGPKVMRKMTAMLTKLPPFYYHQIKDAPHFLFYLKEAFIHSVHYGGVQQRNEWHPWGFGVKLRGEGVSLGPVLSLMFRSITCFFWGGVFFFGRECFFWGGSGAAKTLQVWIGNSSSLFSYKTHYSQ